MPCAVIVPNFELHHRGTGRKLTDEKRGSRHTPDEHPHGLSSARGADAASHLSCNTGRAAHLKLRVLVCSPFGLTPGLSSKLSIAAI